MIGGRRSRPARDLLYKGFKGQKEGACASRKRRVTQSENSMIQWLTFSIQLMTALVFFEEAPVGGNKEPFGSSKSSRITNSWSYGPVKRISLPPSPARGITGLLNTFPETGVLSALLSLLCFFASSPLDAASLHDLYDRRLSYNVP